MSKSELLSRLAYFRHPALPGVELLVANPSVEIWRMYHQRYVLCGCPSIDTSWVYRGKQRSLHDGMTAFMEPGEMHRVVSKSRPSRFGALFIDEDQMLRCAEELGVHRRPHFGCAETANPLVLRDLMRFSESLQQGADTLKLQERFSAVMHRAMNFFESKPEEISSAGMNTDSLGRAREFLEEHRNESVTLDQLAAVAAMSRFHLARRFTQEFGISPHACLIQMRVKNACMLLREGMSCVDVAPFLGFADQSHFTRHFKRVMGVTPGQYAHAKISSLPLYATM